MRDRAVCEGVIVKRVLFCMKQPDDIGNNKDLVMHCIESAKNALVEMVEKYCMERLTL